MLSKIQISFYTFIQKWTMGILSFCCDALQFFSQFSSSIILRSLALIKSFKFSCKKPRTFWQQRPTFFHCHDLFEQFSRAMQWTIEHFFLLRHWALPHYQPLGYKSLFLLKKLNRFANKYIKLISRLKETDIKIFPIQKFIHFLFYFMPFKGQSFTELTFKWNFFDKYFFLICKLSIFKIICKFKVQHIN